MRLQCRGKKCVDACLLRLHRLGREGLLLKACRLGLETRGLGLKGPGRRIGEGRSVLLPRKKLLLEGWVLETSRLRLLELLWLLPELLEASGLGHHAVSKLAGELRGEAGRLRLHLL